MESQSRCHRGARIQGRDCKIAKGEQHAIGGGEVTGKKAWPLARSPHACVFIVAAAVDIIAIVIVIIIRRRRRCHVQHPEVSADKMLKMYLPQRQRDDEFGSLLLLLLMWLLLCHCFCCCFCCGCP